MRAMVLERYGGPEWLSLREVPTPRVGRGRALVRVRAASINDWDWAFVQGQAVIRAMGGGLLAPKVRILGGDIAGVVEDVGAGVDAFRPGDEVYGDLCMSGFGAFAEYVNAPASCLVHKPRSMGFEQAAAIPQAGMLAVQGLLDVGRIRKGQRVLLNGAGGGVGTFAIQLARLREADVTAVDKAGKLDLLRSLGARHTLDYERDDFARGGEQYDLILDTKTSRGPLALARALRPGGIYATVGGSMARMLQILALGPLLARTRDKRLRIVSLKPNEDLDYMNERFEAGEVVPVIEKSWELAELPEAMRFFGTGDHRGKLVVRVD